MTKKKKEKTAKNKGQWIAYVVFILTGAACGIFVPMYTGMAGQPEKGIFSDIMPFVLMLIGTYVAMLIQIVFHEAGHLIFGLMTGYRFSSFRIANLMWVKLDGRIQFRKLHIAGTGGQCLMIPPDLKDGKIPVMLYNFGGAIMNLVTAVLSVLRSCACGRPGDEMRLFLTEDGYQAALQSQQRREIKIKRYARVIEGHILDFKPGKRRRS